MIWFQSWTKDDPSNPANRYLFRNRMYVDNFDTKLFEIYFEEIDEEED